MDSAHIVQLEPRHGEEAARLLVEGFREHWPEAWPDLPAARREVEELLAPGRLALAALDGGRLVGWVGALPSDYGEQTWELHPLVVDGTHRRRGVGRALVDALRARLARRGVGTLYLGSDDDDGSTSLGGRHLFPGVLGHLGALADLRGHPFGFYRRLGFEVIGVIPDANGPGRHDILMACSLRDPGASPARRR